MVHFIFMVLPGVLAFSILYGGKRDKDEAALLESSFIFRMIRDLILMIFLVNLLGLYLGKILFGARETFIDGGLHPHLLSLGYLLLVTLISVVTGKLAGVYKTNFRIYVSKDKVKGEEVKS